MKRPQLSPDYRIVIERTDGLWRNDVLIPLGAPVRDLYARPSALRDNTAGGRKQLVPWLRDKRERLYGCPRQTEDCELTALRTPRRERRIPFRLRQASFRAEE